MKSYEVRKNLDLLEWIQDHYEDTDRIIEISTIQSLVDKIAKFYMGVNYNSTLTPKEKELFEVSYGVDSEEDMTLYLDLIDEIRGLSFDYPVKIVAEAKTGIINLDENEDLTKVLDSTIKLSPLASTRRTRYISLTDLLKEFSDDTHTVLDTTSLRDCVSSYNRDIELRNRILGIVYDEISDMETLVPKADTIAKNVSINWYLSELQENLGLSLEDIKPTSKQYTKTCK